MKLLLKLFDVLIPITLFFIVMFLMQGTFEYLGILQYEQNGKSLIRIPQLWEEYFHYGWFIFLHFIIGFFITREIIYLFIYYQRETEL